jgi:hypothetical protein
MGEKQREELRHEGEDSESRREEACSQGSREKGGCEEEEVRFVSSLLPRSQRCRESQR